jgi:hypothetical protein
MRITRLLGWALFWAAYRWGRVLHKRQQLIWDVKK